MRTLRVKPHILIMLFVLTGCSLAPKYVEPTAPVPGAYKEVGPWAPAMPQDAQFRGEWWQIFGDTTLNRLEQKLDDHSPNLEVALSRFDQAQSIVTQEQASLVPEIDIGGNATRDRQSEHRPLRNPGSNFYSNNLLEGSISYEFDLWGRVRNEVAAARAGAQASSADAASVRLSLEAKLADAYFNLRGLDADARLLGNTAQAYDHALRLTEALYSGGAASGLDVGRAQTQLSSTEAQISRIRALRALREHEIASLVAEPASSFSVEPVAVLPEPPVVPVF